MILPKSISNIVFVSSDDETQLLSYDVPEGMELVIRQTQFFKDGSIDYANPPTLSIKIDGDIQGVDPSLLLLTGLASNLFFRARKNIQIAITNGSGLTVGVYIEGYLQEAKHAAA